MSKLEISIESDEKKNRREKVSGAHHDLIMRMARSGASVGAIADELHYQPVTIRKFLEKQNNKRVDALANAVFLGGLGVIFLSSTISFLPGLFFVLGLTSLVRGVFGKQRNSIQGAVWLFGFGVLFADSNLFFPGILFVMAISGLVNYLTRPGAPIIIRDERENEDEYYARKRKNNEAGLRTYDEDDEELEDSKPKRSAMRLGADGELLDIVDVDGEESEYDRRRR